MNGEGYDPSSVRMMDQPGRTLAEKQARSINVYLDELERELSVFSEQLSRLEDKAHTILTPEYPDAVEKRLDQDVPETSPVGSRILNLASALAKHNRNLINIVSRIET